MWPNESQGEEDSQEVKTANAPIFTSELMEKPGKVGGCFSLVTFFKLFFVKFLGVVSRLFKGDLFEKTLLQLPPIYMGLTTLKGWNHLYLDFFFPGSISWSLGCGSLKDFLPRPQISQGDIHVIWCIVFQGFSQKVRPSSTFQNIAVSYKTLHEIMRKKLRCQPIHTKKGWLFVSPTLFGSI